MISVIIPTYNRANLLPRAIESILNQTWQDFEIIVVDDGSTDETSKVVIPYRDRIRYLVQPNSGPAKARNLGIKVSNGEWIAFLDDDDAWIPEKLEVQTGFLAEHPEVDFIFSDFSGVDETGKFISSYIRSCFGMIDHYHFEFQDLFSHKETHNLKLSTSQTLQKIDVYWGNIHEKLIFGSFVSMCTLLIRKEVIVRNGGFRERFRMAEDYDFIFRMSKGSIAAYQSIPTFICYLTPNSQTRNPDNSLSLWMDILGVVNDGIQENINFLKRDTPRISYRLAFICRRIAYYLDLKGERKDARKYWRMSILECPSNIRGYIGFLGGGLLLFFDKSKKWVKNFLNKDPALKGINLSST